MTRDAHRVRVARIPNTPGKVVDEGGELHILLGSDHGLDVSIMVSRVVPGSGPVRHRHPHDEVIAVTGGEGTFDVDGVLIDAAVGDAVVVPSGAWHAFRNTGRMDLHILAVHDASRAPTEFEDGRIRD